LVPPGPALSGANSGANFFQRPEGPGKWAERAHQITSTREESERHCRQALERNRSRLEPIDALAGHSIRGTRHIIGVLERRCAGQRALAERGHWSSSHDTKRQIRGDLYSKTCA